MEIYKEQMQRDMVLRNLSPKTQKMYLAAAGALEKYFSKPPDQLNENDVKAFLLSIIHDRKLSQSTLKINYSALRFLYETTLHKGGVVEQIPYPKTTKSLPNVLSKSDIGKILDATVTLKQKVMLMVVYSAGLRAREAARLKIADIDSSRMLIRVEQGKGRKDRYTSSTARLLPLSSRSLGYRDSSRLPDALYRLIHSLIVDCPILVLVLPGIRHF